MLPLGTNHGAPSLPPPLVVSAAQRADDVHAVVPCMQLGSGAGGVENVRAVLEQNFGPLNVEVSLGRPL